MRSGRRGDRRGLRQRARFASSLAVVLPVLVLIGCGSEMSTLNTVRVERSIAATILAQHHIEIPVSCPANIPLEVGRGFECRAKLEVGTYPIRAIEVNGAGRVRYANQAPLVILNVAAVKQAIARSIRSRRHAPAIVSCPGQILQKQGVYFVCSALVSGHRHAFDVVQVDDHGHVRYVEASR
jgi:hypothetical protein